MHPHSSFIFHAFGEVLCKLKAEAVPSRTVTNDILACYRMNEKIVARFTDAGPSGEDEDSDQYDGEEAIEALMLGTEGGLNNDFEDGGNIE